MKKEQATTIVIAFIFGALLGLILDILINI